MSNVLASWCHDQVAHADRGITINQVRISGFWVIGLNNVVISTISKCVRCKHLRGRFQQQKMADLPRGRMREEAPFTFCGVDMFGPFVVKNGRKEMKRYGAFYTCLSSRAIHSEVTYSLNTVFFIMCLRGFNGNVRLIKSNNGSNFIGIQQSWFKHFKRWIIQGSVISWKKMVENGSIRKGTLHLPVTWGEFWDNNEQIMLFLLINL